MKSLKDLFEEEQPPNPYGVANFKEQIAKLRPEKRKKVIDGLKNILEKGPFNQRRLETAKQLLGNTNLKTRITFSQHYSNIELSLKFLTEIPEDSLSPAEAKKIIKEEKPSRSTYAQRLKSAFIYLIRNEGTVDTTQFRYSIDGEHLTKGYRSIHEADEPTISHQEAKAIITKNQGKREEIFQTKTITLFPCHNNHPVLTLKKLPGEHNGKALYLWETHPSFTENKLRRNKEYRIIWPIRQKKELVDFLNNCTYLALNKASETLGEEDPAFITIFEKIMEDKTLIKAILIQAKNKTEANLKAQNQIDTLWQTHPHIPTSTLTCLTRKESALLAFLLNKNTNREKEYRR